MARQGIAHLILSVTMEKPLWASTVSTIDMAPTRKKTICAISARLSSRAWMTSLLGMPVAGPTKHQQRTPMTSAVALLLMSSSLSNTMARYPMTNVATCGGSIRHQMSLPAGGLLTLAPETGHNREEHASTWHREGSFWGGRGGGLHQG